MKQFFVPPVLSNIVKLGTVARSTIYTVTVMHRNSLGYPPHSMTYQFVGPTKGPGDVVMLSHEGTHETHVPRSNRYGKFGPDWIRNYFSEPKDA